MKIVLKFIITLVLVSTYAQAKVGTCEVGQGKEKFVSCLKTEATKTQSIEDMNFLAAFYAVDKNYDKAIVWYKKSANKGDAKAAFFLGGIYDEALDEKEEALKWYRIASLKDYPDAMQHLNEMMEEVHGKSDAIEIYQKEIDKGEEVYWNKQFLANFYFRIKEYKKREQLYKELIVEYPKQKALWLTLIGDAYSKNFLNNKEIKLKYYREAAALGSKNAMHNLGIYYGDKGDYETAKEWFIKANKPEMVCYMYKNIMKDKEKALGCYEKLAESGNVKDLYALAYWYHLDYKKYKKAIPFYQEAVKLGMSDAALNLAVIYRLDLVDKEKMLYWYKKAASMGNQKAIKYLSKKGLL